MKRKIAFFGGALLAAAALILASCADGLTDAGSQQEGLGYVSIATGYGARTVYPTTPAYNHYDYTFTQGTTKVATGSAIAADLASVKVALEAGAYTLTLNAYLGEEAEGEEADATGATTVTVEAGKIATATVALEPASSGEGTFTFTVTFPGGTTLTRFTLTTESAITLVDAPAAGPTTTSGSITVASGTYPVEIELTSGSAIARKFDIVHIYNGQTTELAWEFVAANFKPETPSDDGTDITPPTLSNVTATADTTDGTKATVSFTSNEAGTYYVVVLAATATGPTSSENLKLAYDAGVKDDTVAIASSTATASTNSVLITGLSANTAYKAYITVEDAAGNYSSVAATDAFTTVAVTFSLTTPTADGDNTISTDQDGKTVTVEVKNGTASVVITGGKTAAQTVTIAGTNKDNVTAGGTDTDTAPTYTVNTSGIESSGGTYTFTLKVSETGKSDITYTVTVTVAPPMTFALTTPEAGGDNTISTDHVAKTVMVEVKNGTASVEITGGKTAAQTVTIEGTDADKVTADNTAPTAPTYTVSTSEIASTGGTYTFTLKVSETGKSDITYTVTVTVADPGA